jgi:hypothetical protein
MNGHRRDPAMAVEMVPIYCSARAWRGGGGT